MNKDAKGPLVSGGFCGLAPHLREPARVEYWDGGDGTSRVAGETVAVGFFFGNTEPILALWNVIAGISGFDG